MGGTDDTTMQQPVMTFTERSPVPWPGIVVLDFATSSFNTIRLQPGAQLVVGRSSDCDLVLTGKLLSRRHLTITRFAGGFLLEDTSANGTVVEGARMPETLQIADAKGDVLPVVRLGGTFIFLAPDILPYSNGKVRREGSQIVGALNGAAYDEIDRASSLGLTLLVEAETGAGKDAAAKRYHTHGPRKSGPYLAVNCANLQANLLEATLFGTRKGAFTGAETESGLFAAADGGTLFLDEVGELDLQVQAKLLRVLQDGSYTPVGSTQTRRADVRVVAATNRDLEKQVTEGRFRADLLHRIAQARVTIHPLRARREEMPMLVRSLLGGLEPTIELVEACMMHPWPGNVRELEPVMLQAAHSARSRGAPEVEIDDLPATVQSAISARLKTTVSAPPPPVATDPRVTALIAELEANGGDVEAAGKRFDLGKSRVYQLLETVGYKVRRRK